MRIQMSIASRHIKRRMRRLRSRAARARRLGKTLQSERLEDRLLLASDLSGWHNAALPTDVNNDGETTVQDAMAIVNELIAGGSRMLPGAAPHAASIIPAALGEGEPNASPPLYLDVNGDQFITPADVMTVVQQMEAEGEDSAPPLIDTPPPSRHRRGPARRLPMRPR